MLTGDHVVLKVSKWACSVPVIALGILKKKCLKNGLPLTSSYIQKPIWTSECLCSDCSTLHCARVKSATNSSQQIRKVIQICSDVLENPQREKKPVKNTNILLWISNYWEFCPNLHPLAIISIIAIGSHSGRPIFQQHEADKFQGQIRQMFIFLSDCTIQTLFKKKKKRVCVLPLKKQEKQGPLIMSLWDRWAAQVSCNVLVSKVGFQEIVARHYLWHTSSRRIPPDIPTDTACRIVRLSTHLSSRRSSFDVGQVDFIQICALFLSELGRK